MRATKKNNDKSNANPPIVAARENIDDDDVPMLDETFWSKAEMGSPLRKQLISLRLDCDVIKWFKEQGANYQPRMNQVLRSYMEFTERETARNRFKE